MGHCSKTIAKTLPISRRAVDFIIKRFEELVTTEDHPGRERKTNATSTRIVNVVRDMVRGNPKGSMRKFVKKLGIRHNSARRLVCRGAGIVTLSMPKGAPSHCIHEEKLDPEVQDGPPTVRHRDIVSSDEKLFTSLPTFSHQIGRGSNALLDS
uniref:HTH_Tnp_Tc3_2 domain-containing protein n=1 Tax=Haemonchus contortus TaxID=6289 RepID=A0A7I4XUQ4_HAECO